MTAAVGPDHRVERIPEEYAGQRVDKVLARLFPQYSRSTLQQWLKQGRVLVDDDIPSQKDKVLGGESVDLAVPDAPAVEAGPEDIPLDLRYSDDCILILNKPAGMVVHPGAGCMAILSRDAASLSLSAGIPGTGVSWRFAATARARSPISGSSGASGRLPWFTVVSRAVERTRYGCMQVISGFRYSGIRYTAARAACRPVFPRPFGSASGVSAARRCTPSRCH